MPPCFVYNIFIMESRTYNILLRPVLVFIAIILSLSAYAQNSYTVRMKLTDSKTGEPVGFVTASLTIKGEKTPAKYVLSDSEGAAAIQKVRKGIYILKAELLGYKTYTQEISVDKDVNLGVLKMVEDVELLDAANVSAVGNPIIVKKDTIEYNASSFKTSDKSD